MNKDVFRRKFAGLPVMGGLALVAALFAGGFSAEGGMSNAALAPEFDVGAWIWDREIRDRQECRFVRSFEIPRGAVVKAAQLRITADNYYVLYLDGRMIGRGADWRVLIEYDLKLLLAPGKHVIAVDAFNDFDTAGFLMGLRVELEDGSRMEINSDESWKIAPNSDPTWNELTGNPGHWTTPVIRPPEWREARPAIYQAPVSQPLVLRFWQEPWFQISMVVSAVVAAAGCIFLLSKLVMKSKMEAMMRRERARIAADLHDGLGGGLTQLVLLGDISKRAIPEDSSAHEALANLPGQTRDLLRGMNEAVWLINSQRDNLRDFASYVGKYAETFFQNSPVRCRFSIEPNLPSIPCDIAMRRNLFLAVKEALNNVLRHSEASEVLLTIRHDMKSIMMTISDNGVGLAAGTNPGGGNGLANMRQRASDAHGTFDIRSNAEGGTTMSISAPMDLRGRTRLFGLFSRRSPDSSSQTIS